MTTIRPVYVHRCSRCGVEYFGFERRKPVKVCGQCGNGFLAVRQINQPAPATVAQAERETAAR